MTRIPDPTDPQPGDEFTRNGERRTILARHGDWCWVDKSDDDLPPVGVHVTAIADHYRPVVTWPDLPPDPATRQVWQGGDGSATWWEVDGSQWVHWRLVDAFRTLAERAA